MMTLQSFCFSKGVQYNIYLQQLKFSQLRSEFNPSLELSWAPIDHFFLLKEFNPSFWDPFFKYLCILNVVLLHKAGLLKIKLLLRFTSSPIGLSSPFAQSALSLYNGSVQSSWCQAIHAKLQSQDSLHFDGLWMCISWSQTTGHLFRTTIRFINPTQKHVFEPFCISSPISQIRKLHNNSKI